MATNYPTSIQSIPNPTSTDLLENATAELDHDYQHATINDTVEALEAKVGVDGSAVTTSHDYKLGEVTGSDKAVGKTATQTLTNKTLTSPQINFGSDARGDLITRNGSGTTVRFPIGTSGQILQVSSGGDPEWVANPAAADASTTVKGVVEEATLSETLARTTAGGTSARLFVNPSTLTTVQTYDYAASSGGTDTYAITVTPAPTAYVTGQVFRFKADVANTGAATLNVNSLGAKSILNIDSSALIDSQITANSIHEVVYDGTNFLLQTPNMVGGNFSISTDIISSYHTFQVPILTTSGATSDALGWGEATTTYTTSAGGYARINSSGGSSFTIGTALPGTGSSQNYQFDSTKTIRIKFRIRFPDTLDIKGFGITESQTGNPIYQSQTATADRTVRFLLNGTSMYAVNSNGTSNTNTDVSSGITFTNWNTYEIIFTPGTSALFYINGNLVATHTTNLPGTSATVYLNYGNNTNGRQFDTYFPIVSIQN